jgi:hypothetical protein
MVLQIRGLVKILSSILECNPRTPLNSYEVFDRNIMPTNVINCVVFQPMNYGRILFIDIYQRGRFCDLLWPCQPTDTSSFLASCLHHI